MSSVNFQKKVIAYIDGFNLYFGIKAKYGRKLIWLNPVVLAENLLKPGQRLTAVKYFTSRLVAPPDKVKRQTTFIEALETLPNVKIIYGRYQLEERTCPKCGYLDQVPHEKKTDVNIAVEMLADAVKGDFDTALLMSADADLVPALEKIGVLSPLRNIVIAFPPGRYSKELAKQGFPSFVIGRRKLEISQFPDEVIKASGFVLKKPEKWK
ncbi:NYN domain-containing protein [bacterium]|nr:MAG: NYN domain-containing protein [bacterium]